ncbi:MAG TPA: ArsR family transcriptional regulator [Actinobacteria bacterium]|nr:ArsR family transcriptional regulator [Actinomycetota bacterium]
MTDPDSELRPVFEIEDLRTLEILIDPLRMRILYMLTKSARTVRELADELELPVTRLYYHVNMLADAGIIDVAGVEKVGAMTQRRFRAVAKEYSPAKSLVDLIQNDRRMAEIVTALVLEGARVDAEAMLAGHRSDPDSQAARGALGRTFFRLSPDRIEHWATKMGVVVEEMAQESDETEDGEFYGLTFVFAPLVSPVRGGAE